ncbi:MAG TPA: GNAT family N-acetyltransferase [Acidobacteriaceae bacterium]|jgi:GNAT superfamily N-acetyltransferase
MPTIRRAAEDDVDLIAQQRHRMFADNKFATEERLETMDATFAPWVRAHLAAGTYVGLLLEEDGEVLAGAGIYFMDWPPHYLDIEPVRAYLLNFYTAPQARGRGYANLLLKAAVEEAQSRGIAVTTLHASPFGRPIYEKFGFKESNEMMLRAD